jgi:hypothetical protein
MQPVAKVVLTRRRHQEFPERFEALALVGSANVVRLAKDLLQEQSFGPGAESNAFAHLQIEKAEVFLHLPEVSKESLGGIGDLQVSLFDLCGIEGRNAPFLDTFDLALECLLARLQLLDAGGGVLLRSNSKVAQQMKQSEQAGFGTDKLSGSKAFHPLESLFSGRSKVKFGVFARSGIVLSQP